MLFNVLGPLEVIADGVRIEIAGVKPRLVLLQLLVHAGMWVSTEAISEVVWAGKPLPPSFKGIIRTIVWQLRHLSPMVDGTATIAGRDGAYQITCARSDLDQWVFEDLTQAGHVALAESRPAVAAQHLEAALKLWRGQPFDPLSSATATAAASLLVERRDQAASDLADALIALGRPADAVPGLRAATVEQPLREQTWLQLVEALRLSGRRADAMAAYHEIRGLLGDQLGVDPSSELQAAYRRLLDESEPQAADVGTVSPQRPSPSAAHPGPQPRDNLPHTVGDFTGRADELRRITTLARGQGSHGGQRSPLGLSVVAVEGMAGVGKTTLAVQAAHLLAPLYPDGQLFIDLHGHSPTRPPLEPVAALDSLLLALGTTGHTPEGLEERAALWRALLAGHRFLLVLDNAADADQVIPLLPGSPGCLVIITSRRRLTDLDDVQTIMLGVLTDAEAGELFRQMVGDRRGIDDDVTGETTALCGNLPLAIRIAAGRLRARPAWTVADLARGLREEGRRLDRLATGSRSVAAAIALSYNRLPAQQQRCFRLLGLVPGTDIDVMAAARLADLCPDHTETLLEDLLDANLLSQMTAGRYRFHDLISEFSQKAVREHEPEVERRAAVARLLQYYFVAANAAANTIEPGRRKAAGDDGDEVVPVADAVPRFDGLAAAMNWLSTERPNLIAAINHAAGDDSSARLSWQIAHSMWQFSMRTLTGGDRAPMLTALTAAGRVGDRSGEAHILTDLGAIDAATGRLVEARDQLKRALVIHRELGDARGEAATLANLASVLKYLGNYSEALEHGMQSLTAAAGTASREMFRRMLNDVGGLLHQLGLDEHAIEVCRHALDMPLDVQDAHGDGIIRHNLGLACRATGRLADAVVHMLAGVALHSNAADRWREAQSRNLLGHIHTELGRPADAIDNHRLALGLLREVRLNDNATFLNDRGDALLGIGEHGTALALYRNALSLAEQSGQRPEEERALRGSAAAHDRIGARAAAAAGRGRAVELLTAMRTAGDPTTIPAVLHTLDKVLGRHSPAV